MASIQTDRTGSVNSSSAIKVPCRVATTADINASLSQGALNAGGGGLFTIDGIALNAGDRVLVKNQTDQTTNGIWLAATTAWLRDVDAQDNRALVKGTLVLVTDGTLSGGLFFELTSANPITIGSSNITFAAASVPTISAAMSPVIGASTLAAARTALGDTVTGDALFTAASASAARTTLGVNNGVAVEAIGLGLVDDGSANLTALLHGQCRLTFTDATHVKLIPFNGQFLRINGKVQAIPSAGVSALSTSTFVGGVAAQALAVSTLYLVYAFMNSGTMTLDFVTGGSHATDATAGNIGVEIKSGDSTRTLVGMVLTDSVPNFQDTANQRWVRSWFNSGRIDMTGTDMGGNSTVSTTYVEIASGKRVQFLSWLNEEVCVSFVGTQSNNTTGDVVVSAIGVDSTTVPSSPESALHSSSANFRGAIGTQYSATSLAEGSHFAAPLGAANAGTAQWPTAVATGGIGAKLVGFLGGRG